MRGNVLKVSGAWWRLGSAVPDKEPLSLEILQAGFLEPTWGWRLCLSVAVASSTLGAQGSL